MPDLPDGESVEMQGSGAKPYVLKNVGGVYSCTCPAWRNQSVAIEKRTCKHLRKLRGDAAEDERVGGDAPARAGQAKEETKAPPLLLAEKWDSIIDPTGYWLSEKLDGVRAYWDGKQFWSRQGNLYHAPDWFVQGLPALPLDGELWLDRKQFQRAVSIVRRQDKSEHWNEMHFVIFDAPQLEKPFEARLEAVRTLVQSNQPPHAVAHEHQQCKGLDHLRSELARIESLGGEGLMMRKPGSKYESGRSVTLLKVKNFYDAEARVLKHLEGAGRHKGRLGALFVELEDGTTFSVGTGFSDAERANPPPPGSLITFRYQELSEAGVPRFPSFVGVRAPVAASESAGQVNTVPTAAAAPAAMPAKAAGGARRFEFAEGKSNKFWEIAVAGAEVTVRFGRIGSKGQTSTKSFSDDEAAAKYAAKLIDEKSEKGYEEIEG